MFLKRVLTTKPNKIKCFYCQMSSWRNLVDCQKLLQIAWCTVEISFFSHVLHHSYQKDEDLICPMAKAISEEMCLLVNINSKRYKEYAKALPNFFFSKRSNVKIITLQLLNLTLGHRGTEHTDPFNDNRPTYNRVAMMVINFTDKESHLESDHRLPSQHRRLLQYQNQLATKVFGQNLSSTTATGVGQRHMLAAIREWRCLNGATRKLLFCLLCASGDQKNFASTKWLSPKTTSCFNFSLSCVIFDHVPQRGRCALSVAISNLKS